MEIIDHADMYYYTVLFKNGEKLKFTYRDIDLRNLKPGYIAFDKVVINLDDVDYITKEDNTFSRRNQVWHINKEGNAFARGKWKIAKQEDSDA